VGGILKRGRYSQRGGTGRLLLLERARTIKKKKEKAEEGNTSGGNGGEVEW